MTYFRIDKQNGKREKITKREALKIISHDYKNGNGVLVNNNKVNCTFCVIERK